MEEIEKNSIELHLRNVLLVMLAVIAVNLIQISIPLVAKAGTVSQHMYFEGASKSGDGYDWTYSDGSGILTLNGATFEDGIEFKVPATIVLEEGTENTIYGTTKIVSSYAIGIYAIHELMILGNGTLTVYSCGQGENSDTCSCITYGIYFNSQYETFTIGSSSDNPILNLNAKDTTDIYSYGIYALSKSLIINNGTITSVGNIAKNYSVGLCSENQFGSGELIINGGTIKATAGDANCLSQGIWANSISIKGGVFDIEAGNTKDTSDAYTTDSCGIRSDTTMNIDAGIFEIRVGNIENNKLDKYAMCAKKGITLSDDLKLENCAEKESFESGTTTILRPADCNEKFKINAKYHQITFDEEMQPNTVGFVIGSRLEMVENKEDSVKMESGTTVRMTVNDYPTEGYVVKNVELTDSEGKEIELTWDEDRQEYNFTMPESDVTVKVEYETYEFVANYSGIYDGQPHSITLGNVPSDGTITYSEDENNYSATKPTYTDVVYQQIVYYRVDFKDGSRWAGSGLVTIKPADVSYTAPKAVTGLTYNGTSQALIQAGTAENGTMYYRLGDAYTGTWSTAIPTATESGDYTIYYYVKADNANYQDRGSQKSPIASINVTVSEKSLDTSEGAETIAAQLDQNDNIYSYTGSEIAPVVAVKDSDTTLKEGTDYTISGDTKEIQCGSYSLTVTGKGNYKGSIDVSWSIEDTTSPVITGVEKGEINCAPKTITVTDDIAVDKVTVNGSEVALTEEGTFTFSGEDNKTYTIVATDAAGNETTVAVTVNGQHSYKKITASGDTLTFTCDLCGKSATATLTIKEPGSFEYTGQEIVDVAEVAYSDEQLQKLVSVAYGNNVDVNEDEEEKAYAYITARGATVQAYFTIKKSGVWYVLKDIAAIGDVTYTEECKAKIETARQAYNNLTAEQKALVSTDNLEILTAAEDNYASLKAQSEETAKKEAEEAAKKETEDTTKKETEDTTQKETEDTTKKDAEDESLTATPTQPTVNLGMQEEPEEEIDWGLLKEIENQEEQQNQNEQSQNEQNRSEQNQQSQSEQNEQNQNKQNQDVQNQNEQSQKEQSQNELGEQKTQIESESKSLLADVSAEKNDTDIEGSAYQVLRAKTSKVTDSSIKLTWNRVKGADGYLIYGNRCNSGSKKYSFKLIKTIANGNTKSYTQKKLKKGTYYKYVVCAYKLVNGEKVTMALSKTIYAATTGKYGNVKSFKLNKTEVTLKKGKTFKLKAKEVKDSKKVKKYRDISYESSDKSVATVSKKGIIKAVKKGSCTIYAYAQNGVCKKVKVTVK